MLEDTSGNRFSQAASCNQLSQISQNASDSSVQGFQHVSSLTVKIASDVAQRRALARREAA